MAGQYETRLSPVEETNFGAWKKRYAPNDSGDDYDLRGAFKANLTPDSKTGHWPDTYKKPNHPTFSNESQYAKFGNPGYWTGPNHDQYVAGKKMANPFDRFDGGPAARIPADLQVQRNVDARRIVEGELASTDDPEQKRLLGLELGGAPAAPAAPKPGGNPFDRFDVATAAPAAAPQPKPAAPMPPSLNAQQKRMIPRPTSPDKPTRPDIGQMPYEVGGRVTDATGSPLAGYIANIGTSMLPFPPMGGPIRSAAKVAEPAGRGVSDLARRAAVKMHLADELPPPPTMRGGGAAEVAPETLRRQRAESLDVPIKLMKGQAAHGDERFGLQRFERETAKDAKLGKDLRERYADQNEAAQKNLDHWLEQTGSESPSARSTGKSVDTALRAKADKMKQGIDAAYGEARAAGEMEQRVPVASVMEYLKKNKAAADSGNAGVLSAARGFLESMADKEGRVSLNDLEEGRKMIGRLGKKDATNGEFSTELKKLIDSATEGAGGDLYKAARRKYELYAQQFKDHAVISKLMSTKAGTKDRAVAFEDVFTHSMLNGSLDDVRAVRRVLQTEGDAGRQAWKDLQGETIKYFKDAATKSAGRDIRGNAIFSSDKFNRAIREMEQDGKLDFIFGKQGAQKLRDLNEAAMDIHSVPQGAVNNSGTASVLLGALGEMATGNFSMGTAKAIKELKRFRETSAVKKRVRESLADPSQALPPPP